MPFLDSENIRPLYDVHEGGAPQAFRCRFKIDPGCEGCDPPGRAIYCEDVTRTIMGMITHQRIVHKINQQESIQFPNLEARTE